MKLITELNDTIEILKEETILEEGKPPEKTLYIIGPFIQTEVVNRNKRMYKKDWIAKEIKRYDEQYIKPQRAVGELGHPESITINPDRISHKIESLELDGNDFIGKAKILGTPMGQIVKNLLNEGVRLGVSSRGMGTVKENGGIQIVQEDYFISTPADIVTDPSAPGAFVNGILEGKEWIWDNGMLKETPEKLEKAANFINKKKKVVSSKQYEQAMFRVFNKILTEVNKT